MMPTDPNNNNSSSNPAPLDNHPISPNPSNASSKPNKRNINNANSKAAIEEEAKKWQYLTENHHAHCDFRECRGKRVNGLFICQFSNIPGSNYSQYLRHLRRQNAFKTKPCRNQFGNGYCHSGDQCPFYHNAEEQRKIPEPLPEPEMLGLGGGGCSSVVSQFVGVGNVAGRGGFQGAGAGHRFFAQREQQQRDAFAGLESSSSNSNADALLDVLSAKLDNTYDKLYKQVLKANDYIISSGTGTQQQHHQRNMLRHSSDTTSNFSYQQQQQLMYNQRHHVQQVQQHVQQQQQQVMEQIGHWEPAQRGKQPMGGIGTGSNVLKSMMANNSGQRQPMATISEQRGAAAKAAADAFKAAICGRANAAAIAEEQQPIHVQMGHIQKRGAERWYSTGGAGRWADGGAVSKQVVHGQPHSGGMSNSSSWEDCSNSTDSGNNGIGGRQSISPQLQEQQHFSRAVGATNMAKKQLRVDDFLGGHMDFGKSFHPFSDSYPLKDFCPAGTSAATVSTTSTVTTIETELLAEEEEEQMDPTTPIAENQPNVLNMLDKEKKEEGGKDGEQEKK